MKISQIFPQKFSAKLSREIVNDRETTKNEWLNSYDSKVIKILNQKRRAIELDAFMRTNEIQEKLSQLPQNDTLEMVSNCHLDYKYNGDIKPFETLMSYSMDTLKQKYPNLSFVELNKIATFFPQKENGAIDKQGIHNWLDKLITLLK